MLFQVDHANLKRRFIMQVAFQVAEVNKFFVTEQEARLQRLSLFPTRAQVNRNPGLVLNWSNYPLRGGVAMFPTDVLGVRALAEVLTSGIYYRQASVLSLFTGHAAEPGRLAFNGLNPTISTDAALPSAQALLASLVSKQLLPPHATVDGVIALLLNEGR